MDNNIQIEELKGQVQKLRTELDSLSQSFFKNNFSSSQSFTKEGRNGFTQHGRDG
jgi:hypothetical protein